MHEKGEGEIHDKTKYEGDGTTLSQLQTVSAYTRRVSAIGYTMLPSGSIVYPIAETRLV